VLDEIKRIHGDIWIDLNDIEGSTFVHELLDSESNRLSNQFRRLLYSHTGGHALFTVELLRVLEESGNLIQDAEGYWIESPNLEWGELPTRVEGVIETRIGRLDDGLREILNVASVMGFEFIVPVVAQVNQSDERSLLKALSRELQDKQRLVKETGTVRIAGRECSKYTFSHLLFQQYLYSSLPSDEIRYLNEKTGEILEAICSGQTQTMAVQLARYFTEAKMPERAVEYQIQAGDQARAIHSFAEAEQYYTQAIRVYRRQGQEDQVAKTLMKLGLVYTATNQSQKAQTTYAEAFQSWKSTAENGRAHDIPRSESVLKTITEQPHTLDPATVPGIVFTLDQMRDGVMVYR
jgi:predicted ATPase